MNEYIAVMQPAGIDAACSSGYGNIFKIKRYELCRKVEDNLSYEPDKICNDHHLRPA